MCTINEVVAFINPESFTTAGVTMPRASDWMKRVDIILVVLSIITLSGALWVWMTAMPVARETVFLATTIALVISLVLIVNISILVVLRLQKRVSHLEELVSGNTTREILQDKVVVVTLTNTERRIINRLEDSGGEMAQDELRRATGLSKSTLSVTLSTLERKIQEGKAPSFFVGMTIREVITSAFTHIDYHTGHLTAIRKDWEKSRG